MLFFYSIPHKYYMEALTVGYYRTNSVNPCIFRLMPLGVMAISTSFLMSDWLVGADNKEEVRVWKVAMENALKPFWTLSTTFLMPDLPYRTNIIFGPELMFNSPYCNVAFVEFSWMVNLIWWEKQQCIPMMCGVNMISFEDPSTRIQHVQPIRMPVYAKEGDIIRLEIHLKYQIFKVYHRDMLFRCEVGKFKSSLGGKKW
eukprot:179432_1